MDGVLAWLEGLPPVVTYLVLGLGAAVENLVPPVPADTFVLVGGFLAGRGPLDPWVVAGVTWLCNVGSALLVYGVGRRYGRSFFEEGLGRMVLSGGQLERMRTFYRRWGTAAIFFTRFLPGLRAVVPAFAGISHQPFWPVALPLAGASAIWYGSLVWVGYATRRNLDTLLGWLAGANRGLLLVALAVTALLGLWWWWTRRERCSSREGRDEEGAPLG